MAKPDLLRDTRKFVEHHVGKGCFAPFTGQDLPAWQAFVFAMQCWARGGGDDAIAAMRALVRCAQPKVLSTFVQVIPAIGDWCHVAQIWPRIADGIVVDGRDARTLVAFERAVEYDEHDKPIRTRHVFTHGWNP